MNLSELDGIVEHLVESNSQGYSGKSLSEIQIVIPVKRIGMVGGRPYVTIKNISVGFDWDHGKIFLNPDKELQEVDLDYLAGIQKTYDRLGWDIYENGNLKRENAKLKNRIKELENDQ